jgi:3-methyladenine DNA glycosylase/8-oxoguanine DNA glycosylase
MEFAFHPPFDFALTARAARFLSAYDVRTPEGCLRRLLRLEDGLALVEAFDIGTEDQPRVGVRVLKTTRQLDPRQLEAAARQWLNPERDPAPFYDLARGDSALWSIVAPIIGLRSLRAGGLFESLGLTIIEQQIALMSAQAAERWLAQTYGGCMDYDGVRYLAFPEPCQIADLDHAALTPMRITFRRMNVLLAVARRDLDSLRAFDPDQALRALTQINGVGHWTAAWTVTRFWGVHPYIGAADVALRSAVNRLVYNQPGRADPAVTDQFFARFGAHAGAAAYHTLMRYALEKYVQPVS